MFFLFVCFLLLFFVVVVFCCCCCCFIVFCCCFLFCFFVLFCFGGVGIVYFLLLLFFCCFLGVFFFNFLYESTCWGYPFELHRQVDAIQMGTHSICLYKEEEKEKNTGCNLKTVELLDCALIGVCAVIRSNTVLPTVFSTSFRKTFFAWCFTQKK